MAVVDDMDTTGYAATSGFSSGGSIGYNGYRHQASGDSSGDKATWTFTGLAAGNYRISTTWPAASSNTAAAPFTIRSGGTVLGTATVDQRTAPNDAQISSTWWEDLGTGIYSTSGGDLTIEVSDQTTGAVIADAVRVDPWTGPEVHVTTNGAKVDDNNGVVDFGTAASWWNVEKTFTVQNAGVDSPLTLGSLSVPAGFTLVSGLGSQTLQPGQSTSFTVRLDTSATGNKTGQISLVTNDGNENPFNFTVNGVVNNFQVIDDKDATGFTNSSGFNFGATIGYNSYRHHAFGDNSGDKATWTFNNVPAGTYRISSTWTSSASNSATAPFSVRSNGAVVSSTLVDQRAAPNDVQAQGVWWEDLGTGIYTVAAGTLTVEVSDATTGYVIADALRIEPWSGPEAHVTTMGTKVDDNTGVIDFGTAASWWNVEKTFTVSNAGVGSPLTLGSLTIPTGFTLVSGLGSQTLQPGESTSFTVRLDTSATGTKSGQISLVTNDGNENPFNFAVSGIVNNYQIVDDLDPALFTATSGFANNGAYLGYNTYFHFAYGDSSGDTATWTFNQLPAGVYRISGTWPAQATASPVAPFTIRAGGATIGTSASNQQVAPNDFQSAGVWWEDLGAASYFVGSAPLTVEARDQSVNRVLADAIRIELLNTAPVAVNDQVTVHGWNATTVAASGVLANDSDREGSSLTPTTVVQPQHGTLTWQSGGGFIYTPARDGATSDSFQYRVSDGTSFSSAATVQLTLTNSAPVASTIANRTVDEDGTLDAISLRDFFADLEDSDELLTYSTTSPATDLLELSIDDSTDDLMLSLVANAHGTAEVTVTATDTGGRSATTVFTVTVNALNDAPTLTDRLLTLDPSTLVNGQQVGQLAVADADEEPHTFLFTSGNENAGLTIDNTGRVLVADAEAFDFASHGPFEYTLEITDAGGAVTTAKLALAATDGFSVTGPATAGQNETYTVSLTGGVSFADWTINWGDGAVSTVPGNAISASHVYQSPATPEITAQVTVGAVPASTAAPRTIDVVQNQHVNLVRNGSFEMHAIPSTNPDQWSYFPSIPEWTGSGLELHRNLYGQSADGDQYIELDAAASTTIEQSIAAVAGSAYKLKFSFKGRSDNPISNDDKLSVRVLGATNPDALLTPGAVGGTSWLTVTEGENSWYNYEGIVFTQESTITLRFVDAGISNSYGTFLDNVSFVSLGTPPTQIAPLGPYQLDENTAIAAILLDSIFADLDPGDVLTYQVTNNSNPSLMTATIEDGLLLVDLASNQYGTGSVSIAATDLTGLSVTATVEFAVQCTPVVTLTGPESIMEGATANFVLTLSHPSNQLITVDYQTGNGTAIAGMHFPGSTGTAMFYPGQTSAPVSIATTDNSVYTGDTYFVFGLTKFANAQSSPDPLTLVTLLENDANVAPTLTFLEVTRLSDGAEQGSQPVKFRITRTGSTAAVLPVHFELGGIAEFGPDYVPLAKSIDIPIGQSSVDVQIIPWDDADIEGDEAFFLSLRYNPDNRGSYALTGGSTAFGLIVDNDTPANAVIDIDVDSDNDGEVSRSKAEDDAEAIAPGKVIFNGLAQELIPVHLSLDSQGIDLTGYKVVLGWNPERIRVWSSSNRDPLAKITYVIGTDALPTEVYAEGYYAGQTALTWNLYTPSDSFVIRDLVTVSIIVDPVGLTAHRPVTPYFADETVPEGLEDQVGIRRNGDDDNGDNERDGGAISLPLDDNDLITVDIDLPNNGVLPAGLEYRLVRSNENIRIYTDSSATGRQAPLLGDGGGDSVEITGTKFKVEWPKDNDGQTTLKVQVWNRNSNTLIPATASFSDTLTIRPFNSIVLFIGGNFQDPTTIESDKEGMFDRALQERKHGTRDVHMYSYDQIDWNGTGDAYNELVNAIANRGVRNVGLAGYSLGGGDVYRLSKRLNENRKGELPDITKPFNVAFTLYVDAVTHQVPRRLGQETRRPVLTAYHVNLYQTNDFYDYFGTSIKGSNVDAEITNTDHLRIDDESFVRNFITQTMQAKIKDI